MKIKISSNIIMSLTQNINTNHFENLDLGCSIDTITINDKILFKAKDVAEALGYTNTAKAIQAHVDERFKTTFGEIMTDAAITKRYGGDSNENRIIYITEPGVYNLAFKSKKETALQFQNWVYEDVLQSIRRTGQYKANALYYGQHCCRQYNNKNILGLENERTLHYRVVQYLRKYYPDIIIHCPLGELQDTTPKRIDAKKKGFDAGGPDIIIAVPNKQFNSLAIELKNPKGTGILSDNQKKYLNKLKLFNYKTLVSHDYDEVIREIIEYMTSIKFCCPFCKNNKNSTRFKTKERLNNHIKVIHNLNPETLEPLIRIGTKMTYDGEKPYFLFNQFMLKITHETSKKYYVKQLDIIDSDEILIHEGLSEIAYEYDIDTLLKVCDIIDRTFFNTSTVIKIFSIEEVKDMIFKFYKIMSGDELVYSFKETCNSPVV